MRAWIVCLGFFCSAGLGRAAELDAEVVRMQATSKAFGAAAKNFFDDVDSTVALLRGLPEVAKWADDLKTEHQAEIDQKTEAGRKLESAYAALLREVNLFVKKRESFEKTYQRDFDQALQRAGKMSDQALKSKARNGMDAARTELGKARKTAEIALALLGREKATPLAQRLKEALDAAARTDAELRTLHAAATVVPADAYQGMDSAELKNLIRAEWKKAYPDDEVLGVILHSNTWQRTIRFTWDRGNKEWGVGDTMVLPARVVVKKDAAAAIIYMAYINRHPLAKSQSAGVKTKTSEYVQEEVPLSKVKL